MNKDEALKLALEALEMWCPMAATYLNMRNKAIAAIKDVLKQPKQNPLTLGQKQRLWSSVGEKPTLKDRVNAYGSAIEKAHGIMEK